MSQKEKAYQEFRKIYAENKKNHRKFTQQEIEDNVIEWTTFFRRNIDIFTTDFLEIPVYTFQQCLLRVEQNNDVIDDMQSRGSSKSFVVGITAIDYALLYSNIEILVTSFTLNQANMIIDDKIDKELSSIKNGISPVLRQLRKDGYMTFKTDINGARYVEFGNGSKIFACTLGESMRGHRAQIIITDECVLVKKIDYDRIAEPTLTQRPTAVNWKKLGYKEEPKQIFLSSAKNKTNWMWKHLRSVVNGHFKDKRIKYGFFGVDIASAVMSGIQTINQYYQRKRQTDELSFLQEYLNVFLGNNENSLFKYEDFEKCQTLNKAFIPYDDIYSKMDNNRKYKYSDNEIRVLICDIAISSGNDDDNSIYLFGSINPSKGKFKIENIVCKHGLNTLTQVLLMKRYFYDYKATYLMLDCKGIGGAFFDVMTTPTIDEEFNLVYDAMTVCDDKEIQITSDNVIKDKIQRTIDNNAKQVIVPYVGTAELNSKMHLLFRQYLKDTDVELLVDDVEAKCYFEDNDSTYFMKSSEEKAIDMIPFIETKAMINEATALEIKMLDSGNIKLVEAKRTDTKDRYIVCAMMSLLFEKIITKELKSENENDINYNDWSFLSGDYSNFN